MLSPDEEEKLKTYYYDSDKPASFASLNKLFKAIRVLDDFKDVSKADLSEWLLKQEVNTVHSDAKRKYETRRVIVSAIDYQWDADLANMEKYHDENDGYKYFLLAIDILSKYVWTFPLKSKTSGEVTRVMKSLFQKEKPTNLRTDKGGEFTNYKIKKMFKSINVNHFTTFNTTKANYAERSIKTIKSRLARYMTFKQTHKWHDVLDSITESYNNTYHRTIKQTPTHARKENVAKLWKTVYGDDKARMKKKTFRFQIGQHVRVSKLKWTFQRAYDETWSREIFVVDSRSNENGLNQYVIKDLMDDVIEGRFYEQEMQRVIYDENQLWNIEKVLKRRRRGGENEEFVKFQGWPKKFNQWIKSSDSFMYKN